MQNHRLWFLGADYYETRETLAKAGYSSLQIKQLYAHEYGKQNAQALARLHESLSSHGFQKMDLLLVACRAHGGKALELLSEYFDLLFSLFYHDELIKMTLLSGSDEKLDYLCNNLSALSKVMHRDKIFMSYALYDVEQFKIFVKSKSGPDDICVDKTVIGL